MEKQIIEFYKNNENKLDNIFNTNENLIEGRICHSSILLLYILLNFISINNYLEIGVHNGGSISILLSNNNNINIYGIDLFEDIYDLSKHYNKEKFDTYQYFKRDNLSKNKTLSNLLKIKTTYKNDSTINLIQGNSYFNETEEKFKEIINTNKLDLLFIDGDHTLEGVKNDYERYSKYVKKGGYIIFDDYHHEIIKNYVDNLIKINDNLKLIIKFQANNTKAIDILLQKI
jgi:predicted O-methyltransferase YrrM